MDTSSSHVFNKWQAKHVRWVNLLTTFNHKKHESSEVWKLKEEMMMIPDITNPEYNICRHWDHISLYKYNWVFEH
jgi:hypothetical protein